MAFRSSDSLSYIAPATMIAMSFQGTVRTVPSGTPNPLHIPLLNMCDGQESGASSQQDIDLLDQAADVLALGGIPAALQACALVQAACY